MEAKIIKFIARHHLLTLASISDEGPYCAHAFYAYDPERNIFIISSDETTRHGADMLSCGKIAAAIGLETKIVGKVQGLQITGTAQRTLENEDRNIYINKHPYAVAMEMSLWRLEPHFMKLTDNTLGFGKKIIWNRE